MSSVRKPASTTSHKNPHGDLTDGLHPEPQARPRPAAPFQAQRRLHRPGPRRSRRRPGPAGTDPVHGQRHRRDGDLQGGYGRVHQVHGPPGGYAQNPDGHHQGSVAADQRHHPAGCPAHHPRHHFRHGRRRHAGRRHPHHPWLQIRSQFLHRRPARPQLPVPGHVRRGAGGRHQGPRFRLQRRRRRRRQHQPEHQECPPGQLRRCQHRRRHRQLQAGHRRHQPADRRPHGRPPLPDEGRQRRGRPRRRVEQEGRRRRLPRRRPGHSHPRQPQRLPLPDRGPAGLRHPLQQSHRQVRHRGPGHRRLHRHHPAHRGPDPEPHGRGQERRRRSPRCKPQQLLRPGESGLQPHRGQQPDPEAGT